MRVRVPEMKYTTGQSYGGIALSRLRSLSQHGLVAAVSDEIRRCTLEDRSQWAGRSLAIVVRAPSRAANGLATGGA